MKEISKVTRGELDTVLSLYQSLITIHTFLAGFVFVTIPLVIFSAEISSLYGRLLLWVLLAGFLGFTFIIDLYHTAVLRAFRQIIPDVFQAIIEMREVKMAELITRPVFFLLYCSISIMLLLKGPEWTTEAIIWFLISIGRTLSSLYWLMKK